jgi:hypothetical protein
MLLLSILTMASHTNKQPPSTGSYGSFASASQDVNEVSEEAGGGNSPNQLRVLFQQMELCQSFQPM